MTDVAATDVKAGRPDLLPRAVLLLGAAVTFGAVAVLTLLKAPISAGEIVYLVKSLWYVGHQVTPYTTTDATGDMPLYFYQLGYWQQVRGIGIIPARTLSIGFGVINGLLLFVICRRLTANTLAAAAAVFIFLGTPATAAFFATATPTATVSALHLAAVWLIIGNMGRQRPLASIAMGLLCAVLYFYRQDMALSIVVLVPLYIASIGNKRLVHTLILIAAAAVVTAALLFAFPDKLAHYAIRLPVISPLLERAGLLAPNFTLIDKGSTGTTIAAFVPANIVDGFLLPYSGTLLLALGLFVLVGGPLRVLWIVPLYFFWLAAAHIFGLQEYCAGCIAASAPYFSGIGALAAALTLAMLAHRARQNLIPAGPCILIGATLAVALNTFAPMLALRAEDKAFPIPVLVDGGSVADSKDVETLARWINSNTPPREPLLVLHGLGSRALPSIAFAAVLAEHPIPAQSITPAASRRVINPRLQGAAREAVQAALEEESFWSDATFSRWIDRDYDFVLVQDDRAADHRARMAVVTAKFDLAASTSYRGAVLYLYKRKAGQ